jgi:hypothetical protein
MTASPFRHIGGAIITDYGPIDLSTARNLSRFYQAEAADPSIGADARIRWICLQRARLLDEAIKQAERWRWAAGWSAPNAADRARNRPGLA